MEQVQVIGWAMLDPQSRRQVRIAAENGPLPDTPIVRFDPSWSRTVDLAVGLSIAEWTRTGRVALTESGRATALALWSREDLFEVEREFLSGLLISQALIDRILARAAS